MRRLLAQSTGVAVTAFTIGLAYRYLWDDPSQANVANYIRSGVHGMGLAASGLGANLYFNSRLSGQLRRWPILAEIALRAVVMAIAVSVIAVGLQVVLYDRRPEVTWFFIDIPRIVAITFALPVLSAFYCLGRVCTICRSGLCSGRFCCLRGICSSFCHCSGRYCRLRRVCSIR